MPFTSKLASAFTQRLHPKDPQPEDGGQLGGSVRGAQTWSESSPHDCPSLVCWSLHSPHTSASQTGNGLSVQLASGGDRGVQGIQLDPKHGQCHKSLYYSDSEMSQLSVCVLLFTPVSYSGGSGRCNEKAHAFC